MSTTLSVPPAPSVPTAPPERPPAAGRRRRVVAASVLAALVAVACTSCRLTVRSSDLAVQGAPPNGVHVTIGRTPTDQLLTLSDLVAAGRDVDALLRHVGLGSVRCDAMAPTQANGDRCAFAAGGAKQLPGTLGTLAYRAFWRAAVSPKELGDFSADAMAKVRRSRTSCLHVTIRRYGVFDHEVSANWTYRTASDPQC